MSQMAELLKSFPLTDGGSSESPLEGVRLFKSTYPIPKAYIAADQVGYESPSQFSREFKRYFGQSPADMIRELRAA